MTRLLRKGGIESVRSNFIPFAPRARAWASAVQSIPNATWTRISPLDIEDFDTDSIHDLVTNSSRLTFNTPGIYMVVASVQWAGGVTNSRGIRIYKNGVAFSSPYAGGAGSTQGFGVPTVDIIEIAKGDYLEAFVYQDSGGALNAVTASIAAVYVGPLTPNMVRDKATVSYVTPTQFAALTPQDGDEVYLIADATKGVTWHLRYNAGSASAYKWEFLGGSPITVSGGSQTCAADTRASLVSVVPPRPGDYFIPHYKFRGTPNSNALQITCYSYIDVTANAAAAANAVSDIFSIDTGWHHLNNAGELAAVTGTIYGNIEPRNLIFNVVDSFMAVVPRRIS